MGIIFNLIISHNTCVMDWNTVNAKNGSTSWDSIFGGDKGWCVVQVHLPSILSRC